MRGCGALAILVLLASVPAGTSSSATSPLTTTGGGRDGGSGPVHGLREGVQKAVGRFAQHVGIGHDHLAGNEQVASAAPPSHPVAPNAASSQPVVNPKQHTVKSSGFWLPNDRSLVIGELWWPTWLDSKGKVLGVGRFSEVYSSRMAKTGQDVAVKVIKVKPTEIVLHKRIDREIEILQEIGKNKHIVKLIDVFRAEDRVVLVFERCYGGELFSILEDVEVLPGGDKVFLNMTKEAEFPRVPFGEEQVVRIMTQVIDVVSYLHKKGVVHRDLKLENVLLNQPYASREDGATDCKLIDFGLSKRTEEGGFFSSCGSAYYAAPEVMTAQKDGKGGYGKECDLWAIGVMSYGLLCRQYPFDGAQTRDVLAAAAKGEYTYPDKVRVSDDAKDFIAGCLTCDPAKRLTADQALKHKWIKNKGGWQSEPRSSV